MTDSVRNCELPINESLKLDVLREGLLPHDAPHFIDVGQRIKNLVIVVVEGALQGHTVHTIGFCHKAKQFGQPQFEAVHLLQRHSKEPLEVPFIHLCGIGGPEQVIDHSLPLGESDGKGSGQLAFIYSLAVFLYREGIYLELILQKGRSGTTKAKEVIPGHRGITGLRLAGESPDGTAGVALIQAILGNGIQ